MWCTFFWFFRASPSWWPFFLGFRSNNGFFELTEISHHNNRPLNFSYDNCNEIDCWHHLFWPALCFMLSCGKQRKFRVIICEVYPSLGPNLNRTCFSKKRVKFTKSNTVLRLECRTGYWSNFAKPNLENDYYYTF